MIELNELYCCYKSRGKTNEVLANANGIAENGEFIVILGNNGSGKSTLLKTIAGIINPCRGSITIDNRNILDFSLADISEKIAFVSSEKIFGNSLRAYDIISMGRYRFTGFFGNLGTEDCAEIEKTVKLLGIENLQNRLFNELSEGEKQKVMIAMAIVQTTEIILLDEPTAFIDVGVKFDIMSLLKHLTKEYKKTIIISSHDLSLALGFADKIWLLNNGCLYEGAPEDLILQNKIEAVFSSENSVFDKSSGGFIVKQHDAGKGLIITEGEGIVLHWTITALQRNGFNCSVDLKDEALANVKIKSTETNTIWELTSGNKSVEFSDIYSLLKFLNQM